MEQQLGRFALFQVAEHSLSLEIREDQIWEARASEAAGPLEDSAAQASAASQRQRRFWVERPAAIQIRSAYKWSYVFASGKPSLGKPAFGAGYKNEYQEESQAFVWRQGQRVS